MVATEEVTTEIEAAIESAEVQPSAVIDGVRVVVGEESIGQLMGLLRRQGFDFDGQRGPSGEFIANIPTADGFVSDEEEDEPTEVDVAEPDNEDRGLGELFA